jgi:hypothetical protein
VRDVGGTKAVLEALRRAEKLSSAKGLGAESWYTRSHDGADFVRRAGNILIEAGLGCDHECPFDVVVAARAYAKAIDARTRR